MKINVMINILIIFALFTIFYTSITNAQSVSWSEATNTGGVLYNNSDKTMRVKIRCTHITNPTTYNTYEVKPHSPLKVNLPSCSTITIMSEQPISGGVVVPIPSR